jgi:membrane associated rhomboid family serine protease
MNDFTQQLQLIFQQLKISTPFVLHILLLLWVLLLANKLLSYRLNCFGILPRHPWGLIGIVTSPFLHAGFDHLLFNSIPLFVLANFVLLAGKITFFYVTAVVILVGGSLTWLFGRRALHLGASGVIMGCWSYLLINVYIQGSAVAIILGLVTLYYFSAMFLSIFPKSDGTSWEGHFFGLLGGVAASVAVPILLQYPL